MANPMPLPRGLVVWNAEKIWSTFSVGSPTPESIREQQLLADRAFVYSHDSQLTGTHETVPSGMRLICNLYFHYLL